MAILKLLVLWSFRYIEGLLQYWHLYHLKENCVGNARDWKQLLKLNTTFQRTAGLSYDVCFN